MVGLASEPGQARHHQRQRSRTGLLRQSNSAIGGANGCPDGLWNNVFSGVQGAPRAAFSGQCEQNTVLAASPVTEESPFLYTNPGGQYEVFVPAVQHNSAGPSWAGGSEAGRTSLDPGKVVPVDVTSYP